MQPFSRILRSDTHIFTSVGWVRAHNLTLNHEILICNATKAGGMFYPISQLSLRENPEFVWESSKNACHIHPDSRMLVYTDPTTLAKMTAREAQEQEAQVVASLDLEPLEDRERSSAETSMTAGILSKALYAQTLLVLRTLEHFDHFSAIFHESIRVITPFKGRETGYREVYRTKVNGENLPKFQPYIFEYPEALYDAATLLQDVHEYNATDGILDVAQFVTGFDVNKLEIPTTLERQTFDRNMTFVQVGVDATTDRDYNGIVTSRNSVVCMV